MNIIKGNNFGNRWPIERTFWGKVNKTESCWLWTGSKLLGGYGKSNVRDSFGKSHTKLSHRWSWEIHFGEIPVGMFVCHKCDVRHCVNPNHLFLGNRRDNIQDMINKNRQTLGERNGRSRLNTAQVLEIRRLRKEKMPIKQILSKFGISYSCACHILYGKRWKHI